MTGSAENGVNLAKSGGQWVINEHIQMTSASGDITLSVNDSGSAEDNLTVGGVGGGLLQSAFGSVIFRANENVFVNNGSLVGAAEKVVIRRDAGQARHQGVVDVCQ